MGVFPRRVSRPRRRVQLARIDRRRPRRQRQLRQRQQTLQAHPRLVRRLRIRVAQTAQRDLQRVVPRTHRERTLPQRRPPVRQPAARFRARSGRRPVGPDQVRPLQVRQARAKGLRRHKRLRPRLRQQRRRPVEHRLRTPRPAQYHCRAQVRDPHAPARSVQPHLPARLHRVAARPAKERAHRPRTRIGKNNDPLAQVLPVGRRQRHPLPEQLHHRRRRVRTQVRRQRRRPAPVRILRPQQSLDYRPDVLLAQEQAVVQQPVDLHEQTRVVRHVLRQRRQRRPARTRRILPQRRRTARGQRHQRKRPAPHSTAPIEFCQWGRPAQSRLVIRDCRRVAHVRPRRYSPPAAHPAAPAAGRAGSSPESP